jgi:hypothetical protein
MYVLFLLIGIDSFSFQGVDTQNEKLQRIEIGKTLGVHKGGIVN